MDAPSASCFEWIPASVPSKLRRNDGVGTQSIYGIRISDENDVAMLKAHSSDVVGLLTNYVCDSKEIVKTIFDYTMQKRGADILYTLVDEIISRQLGADLPYSMQELRKMPLLRNSGRQHYIDANGYHIKSTPYTPMTCWVEPISAEIGCVPFR